jgi:hypothetical protein
MLIVTIHNCFKIVTAYPFLGPFLPSAPSFPTHSPTQMLYIIECRFCILSLNHHLHCLLGFVAIASALPLPHLSYPVYASQGKSRGL